MGMVEKHIDLIKRRLFAIEMLKLAKEKMTYRELGRMLGLSVTVVCRYIMGHDLPNDLRAKEIIKILSKTYKQMVADRIYPSDGYLDCLDVSWNLMIADMAAEEVVNWIAGNRVTKILTSDGIVFACAVARRLGLDNILIAKKYMEAGIENFLFSCYMLDRMKVTLYLPKRMLKKGRENVLIVDDVLRMGYEQKALVDLVESAECKVEGLAVLIAVGEKWKEKLGDVPIKAILTISEH